MEEKQRKALIVLCSVLGLILALMIGWTVFDLTVDRSGWVQEDGFVSYLDFHGRKISGWLELEEGTYYFDANYVMLTGWQTLDGNRYYFTPSGAMAVGWETVGNHRYLFGENGVLRTGWVDWNGNRYYLEDDGAMVTGLREIQGKTYYFDPEGALGTGWQTVDGKTYYLSEEGTPVTGRITLDEKHYYFQEDGVMHTGWEEVGDSRRYYGIDGAMATGWAEIEGSWYLFGDDGLTRQGWYTEGEYRYYLQEDGSAAVGPQKIDGQKYYFTPKGIMVVLVNANNPVPAYYKPQLVTFQPWHQVADVALEPLNKMLEDCVAAGYPYVFNSAYRTVKVQEEILWTRTQEYVAMGYDSGDAYAEARKTVALPGTSEHHLGLAMDILNDKKAETMALEWLGQHCWEYGFILRYPAGKADITGIVNEPWHFRYVGTQVSMDLKDSGLCLEEYLGAEPVGTPGE